MNLYTERIGGDNVASYRKDPSYLQMLGHYYKEALKDLRSDFIALTRTKFFVALVSLIVGGATVHFLTPSGEKSMGDIRRMGVANAIDMTGNTGYDSASYPGSHGNQLDGFSQVVTLSDGREVAVTLRPLIEKTVLVNGYNVPISVSGEANERTIQIDTDGNRIPDQEMALHVVK